MIPRRAALFRTALLTLGSILAWTGCTHPRPGRRTEAAGADSASPERLSQDLERLGKRTYSDQGIPVLLICENRAPASPGSRGGRLPGKESRWLAAEFRRQVEVFKRLRSQRTEEDVPKLIEVLADRDLEQRTRAHRP